MVGRINRYSELKQKLAVANPDDIVSVGIQNRPLMGM
jgi:hypothetical protein